MDRTDLKLCVLLEDGKLCDQTRGVECSCVLCRVVEHVLAFFANLHYNITTVNTTTVDIVLTTVDAISINFVLVLTVTYSRIRY
jgi:hypothetical protein